MANFGQIRFPEQNFFHLFYHSLDLDQVRLSMGSDRSKLYAGKFEGETDLAHLQTRQIHRPVFCSVRRYRLLLLDCNNLC